MAISVIEDDDAPGGYAFMDLGVRVEQSPVLLSIRRSLVEPRQLGLDGWQSEIAWLTPLSVDHSGGTTRVRLGPSVVDWIEELVSIEVNVKDVGALGALSWPDITPSPRSLMGISVGAGAATPEAKEAPAPEPQQEPEPPVEEIAPQSAQDAVQWDAGSIGLAAVMSELKKEAPAKKAGRGWLIAALLLIGLGAAGAGAYLLMDRSAPSAQNQRADSGPPQTATGPAPAPPAEAPASRGPGAAQMEARYRALINSGSEPAAFLALGRDALTSGHGGIAFRAFEEGNPFASADAAWELARFYDPRSQEAVHRDAAQPNASRAAYYYGLWKGRSERHDRELQAICTLIQTEQSSLYPSVAACAR